MYRAFLVLFLFMMLSLVDSSVLTAGYRCPVGMVWFVNRCFSCEEFEELTNRSCS